MSRKSKRIAVIILASLVVATGISVLFYKLIPEPPIGDVDYARLCLQQASKSKAQSYSKKSFKQAKADYDSAMKCWQKENEKFILFRDYSMVAKLAQKSAKEARNAMNNSQNLRKNMVVAVKDKIELLNGLILNVNELFNRVPLPQEVRDKISRGKLLLKEAQLYFERGEYLSAQDKIVLAEDMLMSSYNRTLDDLEEYFNSQPYWRKLVNSTIENSAKTNGNAIIIDKFARKLYIYQSGEKKLEFEAEFGKNWMGRKRLKGDKATPEGIYLVKTKIPQNKTKYYRALLLNYPNNDDVEMFRREKQQGKLPANAQIGGLIEIHGNGGKGTDWTDGCIALSDNDMLKVYNFIQVGTPVVIVGSLADFKSITENFKLRKHTERS